MKETQHKDDALAIAKSAELELMALLDESGAEGLENITSDEIKVPRLAILQPTSPLSSEDGFSAGHVVNVQLSHTFGRDVDLIPLFFWTSRTRWSSKELSAPIDCRSIDGRTGSNTDTAHAHGKCIECPYGRWNGSEPPSCTDFKNILLLPLTKGVDLADRIANAAPAVFSAKRTAQKGTNEFLTMAAMLRINGKPAPLFSSVYNLKTVKVDSDKGAYFVPKFTRVSTINDVNTFKYLRQLYVDMKLVAARVADSAIDQEVAEAAHEASAGVEESDAY